LGPEDWGGFVICWRGIDEVYLTEEMGGYVGFMEQEAGFEIVGVVMVDWQPAEKAARTSRTKAFEIYVI
jgi:hypothetical protein